MEKQMKNNESSCSPEQKLDYKKEYKDLYLPKPQPTVIQVPPIPFIMVDGRGNPNDKTGEYADAVGLLYALTYTIKMSGKGKQVPPGYFAYVVPPLEGLWWLAGGNETEGHFSEKDQYCWTAMIRQPAFVTEEILEQARIEVRRKKPALDSTKARLMTYEEGLCIQMMHLGAYDEEPRSLELMEQFMEAQGLRHAIGDLGPNGMVKRHHEIYLNDPTKTAPDKLKTVLRHPVK